jgi:membrane-associated protein
VNPENLLEAAGMLGLFLIVFAESGILAGFFLPGDSLLFTAGLLAAEGIFDLPIILLGCFVAAVAGDQVGYAFGRRVGPALFRKPDSRFFHRRNVERASSFFATHGPKTVVLARFIPVVRTFTPVVAGVGHMHYRTFVTYNILGGLLWAVGITTLGYVLGESIPDIDRYLIPGVLLIIAVSFVPVFRELWKARARARAQAQGVMPPPE